MAYRKTKRSQESLGRMRAGKNSARMERPTPDCPPVLPDLRRTIIVIDHDFGTVEHRLDLYRTNRRDCYRVVADGVEWRERIGWSRVLAGLRKAMPRVSAQLD